jgi:uncharacterized protein YbgA (DUF1722 family)
MEEEGRLGNPRLRENWIERVFAYCRLKDLWSKRWTAGDLVRFHTAHKLVLVAHGPRADDALGRLIARAKRIPRRELRERYERGFMTALSRRATSRRHAQLLQHVVGCLRPQLDDGSRRELLAQIESYRRGMTPLIVPLALVAHYARKSGLESLEGQVYFRLHPKEWLLRSLV